MNKTNKEEITKKVINGEITLKEAFELVEKASNEHLLAEYIYKNMFVQTATHYYTGRLTKVKDNFIVLEDASWIADTGRFHDFLKKGIANEVEPMPHSAIISIGAIVTITEFDHQLPREQK